MKFHETQLPCPLEEFRAKYELYRQEREAHKRTVDVPAPFPEFEIFRTIYDCGGCEIVELTQRERALAAARAHEDAKNRAAIEAAQKAEEDALLARVAADPTAPQFIKELTLP